MNLRISRERATSLLRIAIPAAAALVLFFSGILPFEELLSVPARNLSASIAPYDVASLTNEKRIQSGLPPFDVSPLLTEAAELKAQDMARYSYYAHTGPDGKTMLDWLNQVGYPYLNAGENLVIDRTSAPRAVDAWMNSPDHRANILRPQFTQIGIGVAEGEYDGIRTIFVVQEFGTPRPTNVTLAASAKNVMKPSTGSKPLAKPLTTKVRSPSIPAPKTIPPVAALAESRTSAAPRTSSGSDASSTGQERSTVSFTLAPEFYAPVTLSAQQNRQNIAQSAAPQGASASRVSVWIGQIIQYIRDIF